MGFSSTFNFATRTRPAISAASSSTTGATILQGPHQGAHASNRTGSCEPSTSDAKLASDTGIGWMVAARGAPHFPQTGCKPWSSFDRGTRFLAPHLAQQAISESAILSPYHQQSQPEGSSSLREAVMRSIKSRSAVVTSRSAAPVQNDPLALAAPSLSSAKSWHGTPLTSR